MSYQSHLFIRGFSLLLFVCCSLSTFSQTWTTSNPFPEYKRYYDIYLDESGFGWLVGTAGAVLHTNDSGQTWAKLANATTEDLKMVEYLPSSNGQALIVASQNGLLKTTDGGMTWNGIAENFELGTIIKLEVVSESTLFLSDRNGKIIKSSDAGDTWELSLEEPEEDFVGLSFVSESLGWASTSSGEVYKTSDGGMSWNTITDLMFNSVKSLAFVNENTGFLLDSGGGFYKTTDGGQNWVQHDVDGLQPNANELFVVDENEMYTLPGGGTKLAYSSDGGVNWETRTIIDHVYNKYYTLQLMSNGSIWAVGDYQVVAHSSDAGLTWDDIFSAYKTNLTFVEFVDENLGYTGGAGYQLLKTTDGGLNWTDAGTHGPIMTGFAKGNDGKLFYSQGYSGIYESDNGGQSWTNNLSGVGFIRTIIASPVGHLFASSAVSNYQIHRSTDNGLSWVAQNTPDGLDVRGISFASEMNGYAWGGTELLQTTDGGDNWAYANIAFNGSILDMYFIDTMHGWLLTNNQLLRTINGGTSWEALTVPSSALALIFKNELQGWAVGGSPLTGLIYQTTDGGVNWTLEKATDYRYIDIAFSTVAKDKLCVVGNGGIIEYYDEGVVNGVNESLVSHLNIYPNPGTNSVVLNEIGQDGLLRVFNLNGQLCQETLIQSDNTTINTAHLLPGAYFFLFSDGTQYWAGKWVKY